MLEYFRKWLLNWLMQDQPQPKAPEVWENPELFVVDRGERVLCRILGARGPFLVGEHSYGQMLIPKGLSENPMQWQNIYNHVPQIVNDPDEEIP